MGASIAEGGFDDDEEFAEAHEINVTPFIDVMLVLLIIFMVAAPLSTVDLPVDLPSSTATPQKKPDKPVYITVKSDLPPGPESDAAAAAPAQVEEKEKVEETTLPQEKPMQAEEPDRVIAETT